jgi:ubiquinone/menaquinone biosynthesis C-methylase UbiE
MNIWMRRSLIAIVVLFAAWVSLITQGAYFGVRLVRWFYDAGASLYDRIKAYEPAEEAAFVGQPIVRHLPAGPQTLVLDVAVGTGRLPLALLERPEFAGQIVGLDISYNMLAEARRKAVRYGDRVALINAPAVPLVFPADTFDGVTSVEAMEYMPDPRAAIREMVRVLRPGGWLVITNRIGPTAPLMPGRVEPTDAVIAFLASLGLTEIALGQRKSYWGLEFYVLVFARKPAVSQVAP